MSEERHEELVRSGFEAFNRRDLTDLVTRLHEGVESYVASPLANAGTWHGPQGFVEMVVAWNEAFSKQTNTVLSMRHPDESHVIAEVHQAGVGAGSGVQVEMTIFYLFEIRDDKLLRVHLYPDIESALAAV
jgi:ketosteroid isomerase-like protein